MTLKRFFIVALAAAALLLSSCEEYDVNTNLGTSLAEIGPEGGVRTTTFISNASWEATWDAEDITVEPTSGIAGTYTVTVTVPASTLDVERTFKIQLKARYGSDMSTRYFTITQHPQR